MSATVSTLWYVDAPDPAAVLREFAPDRDAAQALLSRLFPDLQVDPGVRVPLTEVGGTDGPGTAGEDGVGHCLELLREEMENTMALCGRTSIAQLDPSMVRVRT